MPKYIFKLIFIIESLTLSMEFARAELCSEFEFNSKIKKSNRAVEFASPI